MAIWVGLWCFWVVVSRNNHPTLLLNGIATGVLIIAFAASIYFNWRVLVPRYWRSRKFLAYWTWLLLAMSALTVADVAVIQKIYDVLWGPDPRRFGFWVNYGLDFTGIGLHLLLASLVVRLIQDKRRSMMEQRERDGKG